MDTKKWAENAAFLLGGFRRKGRRVHLRELSAQMTKLKSPCSPKNLSAMEAGSYEPSLGQYLAIVEALGAGREYILDQARPK